MMSLETRTNSALFKRAEQLRRWEESDTNREPPSPKKDTRRVKFSSGCVFLAACAAGDKDEVLKLLEKGADINTANVDGLTALHQACIDDNLDMVEFLVDQGADVNRGDNEGWTPLHATASCGLLYIAKYLIEKGANVAAVNNDGELPLDIAEDSKMENFLKDEIHKRGIDCEAARNDEELAMLRDAKEWLATKSSLVNEPHPKTGATPLHVAAAKGYLDVMKILLQCNADIDSQDVDGWSPLHAAAHWGQEEACRVLVENLADMDAKNFVGQTAFDLADSDMLSVLEDLKKKQNKEDVNKRKAKKRLEAENRTIDADSENQQVKKVKMEIKESGDSVKNNENIEMDIESGESEESESESEEEEETESSSEAEEEEKKNRANAQSPISEKISESPAKLPPIPPKPTVVEPPSEENVPSWRRSISKPSSPEKKEVNIKDFKTNASDITNENEVTLRRTKSFQHDEQFLARYRALHERIQKFNDTGVIALHNQHSNNRPKSDIILTNAQQHYNRSVNEEKPKTGVSSSTTNTTASPTRTAQSLPPQTLTSPQSLQPNNQSAFRSGLKLAINKTPPVTTVASNGSTTPTSTTPTTPGGTRLQIFKNFFKSFVPPVRDEESETQRKAHAKKVRETRRSTQGVTLEEIKSAEQLVKMKNQPVNNNNNETGTNGESNIAVSVTATITTGTPTVLTRSQESLTSSIKEANNAGGGGDNGAGAEGDGHANITSLHERRPSWRLKVDGTSKFKLEDASKPDAPTSATNTPSYVRRLNSTTTTTTSSTTTAGSRPSSAPPIETAETTTFTLPLRRPKSLEDREQENKENDARNAQATLATQAAIQRRKRPKRRSTGVVNFENPDDLDQDKDPAAGGDNDSSMTLNSQEGDAARRARRDLARNNSYRERSMSRSRAGSLPSSSMGSRSISLTSLNSEGYISGSEGRRSRISSTADIRNKNGEIDYKKLYEEQLVENERLQELLKKSNEELRDTKQTLEKINVVTSKNSLSELEKRERRAMERKLSEMEEELKNLENLKSENQRLKDENGALIRVISKLSK